MVIDADHVGLDNPQQLAVQPPGLTARMVDLISYDDVRIPSVRS
jgi:hypothetical protein